VWRVGTISLDQFSTIAALQLASASSLAPVPRIKPIVNLRRFAGNNVRMHPYQYYVQYVPLPIKQSDLMVCNYYFITYVDHLYWKSSIINVIFQTLK